MIRAAGMFLLLMVQTAAATQDQWPALFDVTDVASNDVLNIREAPSAQSAIIGSFSPDETGIEVVRPSDDYRWGLVNVDGRTGWASLSYLARRPGQWSGAEIPRADCGGNEPFWAWRIGSQEVLWSTPEREIPGRVEARMPGEGRRDVQGVDFRLDAETDGVAVLRFERCWDGMSDMEYGLRLDLFIRWPDGPKLYSGCCRLAG